MALGSSVSPEGQPLINFVRNEGTGSLPVFTLDDLPQFIRSGFVGIGIAQAIVEPGDDPRIMMIEHRATGKLGLLSETLKTDEHKGIEHLMETSARCFREELAVEDVSRLGLQIPEHNGWQPFPALRRRNPDEWFVGVTFPLFTGQGGLDEIAGQVSSTEEVQAVRPMRLSEIYQLTPEQSRPFAFMALVALEHAGLLAPDTAGPLIPYNPQPLRSAAMQTDLKFGAPLLSAVTVA